MQIKFPRNQFLKDNIYLLLTALLLLSISVFTKQKHTKESILSSYNKDLQTYISKAEIQFNSFLNDTALLNSITKGIAALDRIKQLSTSNQFYYVYHNVDTSLELIFWSTQTVLPDSNAIYATPQKSLVQLANGYYFIQRRKLNNYTIVSLLPIKWNYKVPNDELRNEFLFEEEKGINFDIGFDHVDPAIFTKEGDFLFSLKLKNQFIELEDNYITVWLRILAFFPLFIFLHFASFNILERRGILKASLFLFCTLLLLRLISYFFSGFLNLRQFALFDPSIYGSNIVLRSLGDLLINVLILLWLVMFVNNNLKVDSIKIFKEKTIEKWIILVCSALLLLLITFIAGSTIRSMVADSQISFDVINIFSLNPYISIVGFLVLCCIAIGYYFSCRIIILYLRKSFQDFVIPLCLLLSIFGLTYLSFRIGNLRGTFELYALLWLLLFVYLIRLDVLGVLPKRPVVSNTVFWLFFFSASITMVIIEENSVKELNTRKHYAEVIATKTDPINDVILNSLLTEFRQDKIGPKFEMFKNFRTSFLLRDSIINSNFSSFKNNYEAKILVYDAKEHPLNNEDSISFNAINSIFNTQAKPTAVAGMYLYDIGYDKFNYISRKIIKEDSGSISGYIFIIINSRKFTSNKFLPKPFNRGHSNSIENSSNYAYAIYKNGKIIASNSDYSFSTLYTEKPFSGNAFYIENKDKYNHLWYYAGANKYVVLVKHNDLFLEIITLFSYLFCAFIILNTLSTLISILLRAKLKISQFRNVIQLTIRQQVHGTIIFFSIISFIIIGITTILFFISRAETNNKEMLNRTIGIMRKDITTSISKKLLDSTNFENPVELENSELQKLISKLSEEQGHEINLYTISGDLKASSLPLPYIKGILSTKIDPIAFYHLHGGKEIQYLQKERIGDLKFISYYVPVTDSSGKDIAYLNVPYFISESRLREEISNFLVTIINLNAFILLIAGIVALIITNRITSSFSIISEKMKELNLAKHNEAIVWNRKDEIGDLVKEYNKMVSKLDESAAALARTERESAWQEMAKQVAHEIKNPLTPMKLSMQFLHRSIMEGSPNIQELSEKVSDTLVEQINHLSAIAEEFSRFANIENAKPEIFNINEALKSVKQLYEGNDNAQIIWNLIPDEVLVFVDKTHINRILTNLILNAIQSVAENVLPIIIITASIIENKLEIKITDNGTGINDEIKSKIFTPNFTTKSSGTGLGLAMCKRMVEQASGDIHFETSNAGTTFTITLPVAHR